MGLSLLLTTTGVHGVKLALHDQQECMGLSLLLTTTGVHGVKLALHDHRSVWG